MIRTEFFLSTAKTFLSYNKSTVEVPGIYFKRRREGYV